MPKPKLPKNLPAWKNEPLTFTFDIENALRRAVRVKLPKHLPGRTKPRR